MYKRQVLGPAAGVAHTDCVVAQPLCATAKGSGSVRAAGVAGIEGAADDAADTSSMPSSPSAACEPACERASSPRAARVAGSGVGSGAKWPGGGPPRVAGKTVAAQPVTAALGAADAAADAAVARVAHVDEWMEVSGVAACGAACVGWFIGWCVDSVLP